MLKRHNQLMLGILKVGDVIACMLAFIVTWSWAHEVYPKGEFNREMAGMTALVAMLLVLPVYGRLGLYSPQRTKVFSRELTLLLRGIFAVWCLSYVAVSLLIPDRPSRVVMALLLPTWMITGGIIRAIGRAVLREMRKRGWNLRHAAIIGTGRLGQTVFHTLKANKWMGIEPHYFVHAGEHRSKLLKLPAIGPYEEIEEILSGRPVDLVFLAIPAREHERFEGLMEKLTQAGVDVRVVPDMLSYNLLRHQVELLGDMPVVNLTHTPLDSGAAIAKRVVDFVVSAVALVVLAPLMALIAVAVKVTSSGPVFYRQVRTSLGGRPFTIVKFRSMKVGAEEETGAIFSAGDADPRLTSIGGFLRRWNLDELPQLWNVMTGHMSLVGPRPERPELVDRFGRKIPRYMLRQHAKAGLTGWAQVNGLRGRTSLRKRVQYDLFYLCNWSLGFDLKILVMTLNPFDGKPQRAWPVELPEAALERRPGDVVLSTGGQG